MGNNRSMRQLHKREIMQPKDLTIRHIPLTHGFVTIVDASDYDWLSKRHWRAFHNPGTDSYYAVGYSRITRKHERMHRLIINAPKGLQVDHINRNTLDNRRCNLRLATAAQNKQNARPNAGNTSGFKGVSRGGLRWRATIQVNKRQKHLGQYDTREEAARAYDKAAKEAFGQFALLNFPDQQTGDGASRNTVGDGKQWRAKE